jgi:hypothetical protein
MKYFKHFCHPIIVLSFFAFAAFVSCSKEEDLPDDTGAIKIISLSATDTSVKAWTDSVYIQVVAKGDKLQYKWKSNHGTLFGSGTQVGYTAGECCVGLNTITCTVYNDTCSVSKDIYIRVTSYFDHKK